jgi:hypothetical protein
MAELIRDDAAWWYLGFNGPATRRLRVWRTGPRVVVAVVTERPDDQGTSITNAAEMVTAQLEIEYPEDQVLVIEHYPASEFDEEHFDAVETAGPLVTRWRRLSTQELAARLGPDLTEG